MGIYKAYKYTCVQKMKAANRNISEVTGINVTENKCSYQTEYSRH